MKEQLISFEVAKLAKEKGFRPERDWNPDYVTGYTDYLEDPDLPEVVLTEFKEEDWNNEDNYLAPTQSLLQKWLREVHNKYISVTHDRLPNNSGFYYIVDWGTIGGHDGGYSEDIDYSTYEEALEEGLKQGLNLIK